MNKCILIGRLVKAPELRQMPNGEYVLQNSIAVNRDYVNQQGERQADFINFVAYRKTAELIYQYFNKGDGLAIEGQIYNRSYQAQDGTTRYVTEIKVDKLDFLPQRKGVTQESQDNVSQVEEIDPFADIAQAFSLNDDDLPF